MTEFIEGRLLLYARFRGHVQGILTGIDRRWIDNNRAIEMIREAETQLTADLTDALPDAVRCIYCNQSPALPDSSYCSDGCAALAQGRSL